MDNLCHTLVGAALGEAGLKSRARLAVPALLLGANIPDVDVLAYLRSPLAALGFRRGWTHGPIGLLVLSLALAGLLAGVDRLTRRTGNDGGSQFAGLLLVTLVAATTHPVLDFLNSYGVRWLMPVDRSWYYGDTLFIVDPWVWGALAIGVIGSRWREHRGLPVATRPAVVSLVAVATYVVAMGTLSLVTRTVVTEQLRTAGADQIMVAPVPLNPLAREILVVASDRYRFARVSLLGTRKAEFSGREILKNDGDPKARIAAARPEGRLFLSWSRFPYFVLDQPKGLVRIMDARYNAEWASVTVAIGPAP